jgi:hypothetical protein
MLEKATLPENTTCLCSHHIHVVINYIQLPAYNNLIT